MRKLTILLALTFWLMLSNTALWFFPEYEKEITEKWEQIIKENTKQSLSSREVYLEKAKSLLSTKSIKDIEEQKILEEYIIITSRTPLEGITKIDLELSNEDNKSVSILDEPILRWGLTPYNRTLAVNYAKSWALKRNPAFDDYGSNDCTNFTSQVLRAWWIWVFQYDNVLTNYKNWWYFVMPTNSWKVAHTFSQNAYFHSDRYTFVNSLSNLQVWDIIQFDWYWDWTVDHSTVITQIVSGTSPLADRIKLSYHSNDRLDKPLSETISWYNNISIYWIHING
jgi:hypothetical protein